MPLVRLIGLVLFITTIFLALAAAATQTTHIRFKQPVSDTGLQFTAVPVIYPLLAAGTLGLLMWFVPAALAASRPQSKRRRKHRLRR